MPSRTIAAMANTTAYTIPASVSGYDKMYDTEVFTNIYNTQAQLDSRLEFYSIINAANPCPRLAIQGRMLNNPFNVEDIIPLGFSCPAGSYTIKPELIEGIFPARKFWLREFITSPAGFIYHDIINMPFTFMTGAVADDVTRFQIVFRLPTIDNLSPAVCNSTLAGFNTLFGSTGQASQSSMGYNWWFTDSLGNQLVPPIPIINTSISNFSFTNPNIPLGFVDFGMTYFLKVGVWNNSLNGWVYSSVPCSVTTPPRVFTNNVSGVTCGGTTPFPSGSQVTASSNAPYTYSWRVTKNDGWALTFDTNSSSFNFSNNPAVSPGVFSANSGFISLNATYCFEVQILYQASPRIVGNFNPIPCCYTTPVARMTPFILGEEVFAGFDAIAYPNPYQDSFNITIQTESKENIMVEIFDIIGKVIDRRTIDGTGDLSPQFGEELASGVYNVIITQGTTRKNVKIIKR